MSFIETPRFLDDPAYGVTGGPSYNTTVVRYGNGYEYRQANWLYPLHRYTLAKVESTEAIFDEVLKWFHAAQGRLSGFRLKDHADYKSCAITGTPAATDQSIGTGDSSTVAFQLQKLYTIGSTTQKRLITKPVTGTTRIAVGGVELVQQWTVDTTTGIVTFSANKTGSITGISQASQATVTATNTLQADDTVYISGVSGMTEINGARYKVVSATSGSFVIDLNTTGYSAYSSGGTYNTIPQGSAGSPSVGEAITAGFEFDVPVRFDVDELPYMIIDKDIASVDTIGLTETR